MKTLDLAETGRLAEELKSGETIELMAEGRAVATVVPVQTIEERVEELIRQGKAHTAGGTLPDWFFTKPRPESDGSIVEQFLADRRKNDW